MATPFRLKRSAVADRRPTTTDLQLGELALNTHDGFLYAETTGVGSTVSLLTPWREQYGSPTSIYYNHRVGIGSTNPTVSLDVVGDTIFQSNLTVSGISTFANNVKVLDSVLTIESVTPELIFNDTTGSPDYKIRKQSGHFMIMETGQTNDSEWRLSIRSGGTIDIPGNLDTHGNLDVDGHTELDNLNVSGISTFNDTVNVNGVIEANSNLNVDGNLDVDGRTELDVTNISETLRVVGVSTFKDNSIIEGSLTVGSATGITGGAPTDQGNLAVYGNGRNSLIIQAGNNNQDRGMAFRNNGDYYVAYISAINMGSSNADLSFGSSTGQSDVGSVTERIRIKHDTGNVGIGSAIPTAKLDVFGQTELDNLNVSGVSTFTGISTFNNSVGLAHTIFYLDDPDNKLEFSGSDSFSVYIGGSIRFLVRTNSVTVGEDLVISDKLTHNNDTNTCLLYTSDAADE